MTSHPLYILFPSEEAARDALRDLRAARIPESVCKVRLLQAAPAHPTRAVAALSAPRGAAVGAATGAAVGLLFSALNGGLPALYIPALIALCGLAGAAIGAAGATLLAPRQPRPRMDTLTGDEVMASVVIRDPARRLELEGILYRHGQPQP